MDKVRPPESINVVISDCKKTTIKRMVIITSSLLLVSADEMNDDEGPRVKGL